MHEAHTEDLALAREVASGSSESWGRLVHRYTGLIISVIRRYLYKEDEDEQRNVYVRVLEDLFTRRLAEYNGSSSLATWIVTIARCRSLDFLRSRYGRHRAPRWIEQGNAKEKAVYTLHYVQGFGAGEIVRRFKAEGESITQSEVVECLHALGARMSPQLRNRLAYELHARNGGSPLDLLGDELRRASELESARANPEYGLFMEEQQQNLDRLRTYVESLASEERDVVQLYFFEGLTARETAERMRFANTRRAYTVLTRAIRRLRAAFDDRSSP